MQQTQHRLPQIPSIIPSPVLWVSSLLYLGVLCAGVYYNIAGLCGNGLEVGQLSLFVGALLSLLILERFGRHRSRALSAQQVEVILLAIRMLAFEGIAAVDCSGFSRTLYLLVPFTAYFCLGKRASYILALLYLTAFLARLWLFVPTWYLDQEHLSDLLMFCLGLVFAISMAGVASEAEEHRARTAQLLTDLETSHQQLQVYAEQVADLAAAEERNRLARDIHDSLGHYLTAITVQIEKAIAFRQRNPEETEQALWDAKRAARQALQDVRHSVSTLRHSDELFSLVPALMELVQDMSNSSFTVDLQISGEESGFPKLVLISLYRAAQEGLTNIQKHARATQVTVRVVLDEWAATLSVDDNGRGFDPALLDALPMKRQGHFGLQGVRERLEMVEGSLNIVSDPNQGTRLMITIPRQPRMLGLTSAVRSADAV